MIDLIKFMAKDWPVGPAVLAFILFVISAVVFVTLDHVLGCDKMMSGIVVEKSYTPATTGTGVGPSIGGKGMSVVVVSTGERYVLFIRMPDGDTDTVGVDRGSWIDAKIGDTYTYAKRINRFTGGQR